MIGDMEYVLASWRRYSPDISIIFLLVWSTMTPFAWTYYVAGSIVACCLVAPWCSRHLQTVSFSSKSVSYGSWGPRLFLELQRLPLQRRKLASFLLSLVRAVITNAMQSYHAFATGLSFAIVFAVIVSHFAVIDTSFSLIEPEELFVRLPFMSRVVVKQGVQVVSLLLHCSPFGLAAWYAMAVPSVEKVAFRHICWCVVAQVILFTGQWLCASHHLFGFMEALTPFLGYTLFVESMSAIVASAFSDAHLHNTALFSMRAFCGFAFLYYISIPSWCIVTFALPLAGAIHYACRRLQGRVGLVLIPIGLYCLWWFTFYVYLVLPRGNNIVLGRQLGYCASQQFSRLERFDGFVDSSACLFTPMFSDRLMDTWGEPTEYLASQSAYPFPHRLSSVAPSKTYNIQWPHGYVFAYCTHPFLGSKVRLHYVAQTNLPDEARVSANARLTSDSGYPRHEPVASPFAAPKPDILIIVMDALDRFWMEERLPATVNVFMNRPHAEVFNLSGFRAVAMNSMPNQLPLFAGTPNSVLYASIDAVSERIHPRHLVNFYREKGGYSVALLDEDCGDNSPRMVIDVFGNHTAVGSGLLEAQMVGPFCHPKWGPFVDTRVHCLFGEYSHPPRLQFFTDFFNNSVDTLRGRARKPKLGFLNMYEAHTRLPPLLDFIDVDIASFLQETFTNHPDMVVLLTSDHGLHYNDDDRSHEFPPFLLSLPKSYDRDVARMLRLNERFQSRFAHYDAYATLLDLMPPHDWSQKFKAELVRTGHNATFVDRRYQSLARQLVTVNRSCDEVGMVKEEYCESFHSEYPSQIERFPFNWAEDAFNKPARW